VTRAELYEEACCVEEFLRKVTQWEGCAEDEVTEAIEAAEKLTAALEEASPQVVPLSEVREALLGEKALIAMTLAFEGDLPYMARIHDFTDEQIAVGELQKADEKAERENRAAFREAVEAAFDAAFPSSDSEGQG
jgi:hypothetical protein